MARGLGRRIPAIRWMKTRPRRRTLSKYDFTAAATNVFCRMTNLVANGSMMVEGATVEDASYPYAPFIIVRTIRVGGQQQRLRVQRHGHRHSAFGLSVVLQRGFQLQRRDDGHQ